MIRIYPEQLHAQLREGLRACYLLIGNEPLLLQESHDAIKACAQQQGFTEHFNVVLDNSTDWDAVFSSCQSMSLFASRQTLTLTLPENGPNAAIAAQLEKLSTLLHSDMLPIIIGARLTKPVKTAHGLKPLAFRRCWCPAPRPNMASSRAGSPRALKG